MRPLPSKNTLHYHKKIARSVIKKFVEIMYFLANISKVFVRHRYVFVILLDNLFYS